MQIWVAMFESPARYSDQCSEYCFAGVFSSEKGAMEALEDQRVGRNSVRVMACTMGEQCWLPKEVFEVELAREVHPKGATLEPNEDTGKPAADRGLPLLNLAGRLVRSLTNRGRKEKSA